MPGGDGWVLRGEGPRTPSGPEGSSGKRIPSGAAGLPDRSQARVVSLPRSFDRWCTASHVYGALASRPHTRTSGGAITGTCQPSSIPPSVPPAVVPVTPTRSRAALATTSFVGLTAMALAAAALVVAFSGLPYFVEADSFEPGPTPRATAVAGAADQLVSVLVHAGALLAPVAAMPGSVSAWLTSGDGQLVDADHTWPGAGEPLLPGISVWLERSVPFTVVSGNTRAELRGQGQTVGEALASAGIYLIGRDYAYPEANAPLRAYQSVLINRVREQIEIQQQTTSFETLWDADPELELDQTRMAREGQEGITNWRYRLTYVNGEQQERKLEDQWVQQEPLDRLMAYGTRVALRQVDSPNGPQEYWRRIRVLITSYSPSTAGKPRSSPTYGITRTGKRAGTGIIAVDPSVIPLGTRIYVPGYGIGVAEDTGNMIIGRHIDVCYDDNELVIWRRWVDVYLLTPVPPEWAIRWVLPNWPREG